MYKIYILREENKIRYVGITDRPLNKRLREHISNYQNIKSHKVNWINTLKKKGIKPTIELLDFAQDKEQAEQKEDWYIKDFLNKGIILTNTLKAYQGYGYVTKIGTIGRKRAIVSLTRNGEFVKRYKSIAEFCKEVNISETLANRVLKKKKQTAKNFILVYEEEYDINKKYKYIPYSYDKSSMKIQTNINKAKKAKREKQGVPVTIINIHNRRSYTFKAISEALEFIGRNNKSISNAIKCLNGERNYAYDYKWYYNKDIVDTLEKSKDVNLIEGDSSINFKDLHIL